MKMIPLAIEEIFRTGAVSKELFDTRNFPVNRDMNGVKYILNNIANHLTRSKVLYYPKLFQDKRTAISFEHTATNSAKLRIHEDEKLLLVNNKSCKNKLKGLVMQNNDKIYGDNVAEPTTLEHFAACTVPLLTAFYKIILYVNLTEVHIMPKKGKPADVNSGIINKKMKGPLLIIIAFNARTMPAVGNAPPLVPIPLPRLLIQPPNVIRFQNSTLVFFSINISPHVSSMRMYYYTSSMCQ